MKTLIATGNPVTLSFAQALLKDADIPSMIFDEHTASLDGPQGLITLRLSVVDEDYAEAVAVLRAADLGHELEP